MKTPFQLKQFFRDNMPVAVSWHVRLCNEGSGHCFRALLRYSYHTTTTRGNLSAASHLLGGDMLPLEIWTSGASFGPAGFSDREVLVDTEQQ